MAIYKTQFSETSNDIFSKYSGIVSAVENLPYYPSEENSGSATDECYADYICAGVAMFGRDQILDDHCLYLTAGVGMISVGQTANYPGATGCRYSAFQIPKPFRVGYLVDALSGHSRDQFVYFISFVRDFLSRDTDKYSDKVAAYIHEMWMDLMIDVGLYHFDAVLRDHRDHLADAAEA